MSEEKSGVLLTAKTTKLWRRPEIGHSYFSPVGEYWEVIETQKCSVGIFWNRLGSFPEFLVISGDKVSSP